MSIAGGSSLIKRRAKLASKLCARISADFPRRYHRLDRNPRRTFGRGIDVAEVTADADRRRQDHGAGAANILRPSRRSARPARPGRARAAGRGHRTARVREDDAAVVLGAADDTARFRSTLLAALAAVPGLSPDSPVRQVGRRRGDAAGFDVIDELIEAFAATAPRSGWCSMTCRSWRRRRRCATSRG
jgi:hypothetical protein